jgi:alpha-aminoadipic semialdehyde synthase
MMLQSAWSPSTIKRLLSFVISSMKLPISVSASARRWTTSTSTKQATPPVTLGVLRENYDKWERRVPLTPSQCHDFLLENPGSKILVQPSSHRIFSNTAYERAGAVVQEDLDKAHIILGVKRPRSLDALPGEKTYLFFSHVIKGQPENMVCKQLMEVLTR